MGRWWTGYTSISAGMPGIAHSHGEPWRFAAAWRLQPSYGYGLWQAKIPSEKMCSITAYWGAGCEGPVPQRRANGEHHAKIFFRWLVPKLDDPQDVQGYGL